MTVLYYLMIASIIVVFAVLMFGVFIFARGGEFNRKYGNKIMQLRLATQAFAVVMIMVYIYFRTQG